MKTPILLLIAVAAGLVVLWILYAITVACTIGGVTNAGIFGDMFGGFSALFNAVGFAAVVAALFLQIRADERQQEQTRLLREQLAHDRQVFEEERKSRAEAERRSAEQHTALKEEAERARRKYIQSIEPHFSFEWTSIGESMLVSVTGRVTEVRLSSPETRYTMPDPERLASGLRASISIEPRLPETTNGYFSLRYRRVEDREFGHQTFRLTSRTYPERIFEGKEDVIL